MTSETAASPSPHRGVAVSCDAVSFAYEPNGANVVEEVSLDVNEGEFFGVLGPNGAGKSTLLRMLAGLAAPTAGRVRVRGHDVRGLSRADIAKGVAFVPQRENTAFGFSARDVVAMGRAPHTGWFGALGVDDWRAVDDALASCDASAFATRPMGELSGGEQKRVLVARALAQKAPIVLLDEPVAFLDIKHQVAVCELLAQGVGRGDFTVVTVLHDLNLAAQFCTRVAFLRGGRLVAAGAIEDVMTYRNIRDTFDADVYVGENEINRTRYYVPMRSPR